jgi:hypothetical protein
VEDVLGNINYFGNKLISQKSVFFEKLIEHRFIADVMMYGWYIHRKEIRILRCETDSSGYDLILDCENKYRFIQLRTSCSNSKRSYQHINVSLIDKQNPCVIWIFYNYNNNKSNFEFRYLFWGSEIDEPTPLVIHKRKAKPLDKISGHNISKGQFEEIPFKELFSKLFRI